MVKTKECADSTKATGNRIGAPAEKNTEKRKGRCVDDQALINSSFKKKTDEHYAV